MVNRSAEGLLGYCRERLIGLSVVELYADSPSGKQRGLLLDRRIRAGDEIETEELEMRGANGQSVWVELTVRWSRDSQGQLTERLARRCPGVAACRARRRDNSPGDCDRSRSSKAPKRRGGHRN